MNIGEVFIAHYREEDNVIQTVKEHLLETSRLTGEYADIIGMKSWGKLIGILHDLGKQTKLFNLYIKSQIGLLNKDDEDYMDPRVWKGKVDHSTIGAQYIYQLENLDETIKSIIALIIKSHHGGLIDCLTPDGNNLLHEKMQKIETANRLKEAVNNLDEELKVLINSLTNEDLLTPLKNNLDCIKKFKDNKTIFYMYGLLIRYLFSCLIDADRQDTADFQIPIGKTMRLKNEYIEWTSLIERLENHISKFQIHNKIDRLRTEISSNCKNVAKTNNDIFQLTVPTGGGKTLSSLRFALHHAKVNKMDRIIYVVPFNTIIDQNAQEVRDILEIDEEFGTIVLEHHSNLTEDEETPTTKLLSENWDAPIIFTSMVQFLDTLFAGGTRSVRRMHQLANSIIIFDEIQTLGVKFIYLFNIAIQFLKEICHSSIVLCTATQPLLDRVDPKSYALNIHSKNIIIKDTNNLYKEFSRTSVEDLTKYGGWDDDEISEFALKKVKGGQSVLIIVNTKDSAIKITKRLIEYFKNVYHLSTSMCPVHRMERLNEMIDKLNLARAGEEEPIICVSTQLIEAGINIDFDVVIRYLAGLDSIVQAAGRCNRNGLMKGKGKVYIINPKNENLSRLKDILIGKEVTERILEEYKVLPERFDDDLLSPKALEKYYEYYFFKRKDEMSYLVKLDGGIQDNIFNLLSINNKSMEAARFRKQPTQIVLTHAFDTAAQKYRAIDTYTQGVIVPYNNESEEIISGLCAAHSLKQSYAYLKLAQRHSVNLFQYQIEALCKKKAIYETKKESGIYYLSEAYYDDIYGLLMESKAMEAKIL